MENQSTTMTQEKKKPYPYQFARQGCERCKGNGLIPHSNQMSVRPSKARNKVCTCGSNKKFKACCGAEIKLKKKSPNDWALCYCVDKQGFEQAVKEYEGKVDGQSKEV